MTGLIEKAPVAQQAHLTEYYSRFIQTLKEALAGSIAHIYALGIFIMVAALITTLFLPVIDLHRARKRPAAEEIGVELEAELGLAEPKDEPYM